jgi:hypothetical protein
MFLLPLFCIFLAVGTINLTDVPEYATPAAPPVIAPTGRKRRLKDFPAAPELSAAVLKRAALQAAGGNYARRKLLQQQQQQQQEQQQQSLRVAASDTAAPGIDQQLASASTASSKQQPAQQQRSAPLQAQISLSRRRLQQQQQQQQQQSGQKQRPGWTGLWWADAGGIGVAAGPLHVLHSVSTVLAVYSVDPASGSQVASKTFALQDLFAPVGAANCR